MVAYLLKLIFGEKKINAQVIFLSYIKLMNVGGNCFYPLPLA